MGDESLGGDGTPAVAAFTPEPLALALGLSPGAGAQLIADALDVRHRLPLLWKRVSRLEVPAWQARRVARQTHRLPKAAAMWVDEQPPTGPPAAPSSSTGSWPRPSRPTTPRNTKTWKTSRRPAGR